MILEVLEDRIAPAALTISANGRSVTWTDVDGDNVTLKITKGTLAETNFTHHDAGMGLAVDLLDLSDPQFSGTSVTVTAKHAPGLGNNSVDLGYIHAAGNYLLSVTVPGDLGRIDAGPADLTTGPTKALGTLKVGSMGTRTDLVPGGLTTSEFNGSVGTVTIAGALRGAIHVTGDAAGSIAALTVGSIVGSDVAETGRVTTTGNLTTLTIRGDLQGGAGEHTGSVEVGGNLTKATISGSVSGGRSADPSTDGTGVLSVDGNIGSLTINGSINGGTEQGSGLVRAGGSIASLTVKGGIYGGSAGQENGGIEADVLGKVAIGGDIRGGAATQSGFVSANALTSLSAGSLLGGAGGQSGQITIDGLATSVTLRGNVQGSAGSHSGFLHLDSAGAVTARDVIGVGADTGVIEIPGPVKTLQLASVFGGNADHSGWLSLGNATTVKLSGDLTGGDLAPTALADTHVSGSIFADHIGTLSISGAVRAGLDLSQTYSLVDTAAIRVANDLVKLSVTGGLLGNHDTRVLITARGELLPAITSQRDLALQQASFGVVDHADILAGYTEDADLTTAAANPNAQIGLVRVTGSWIASNLIAGAEYSDTFGTGTDTKITAGADNPTVFSRIGAVVIGGSVQGTPEAGDHYGFVAQGIGAFLYGPGALAEYKTLPLLLQPTVAPVNNQIDAPPPAYVSSHVLLNTGTANDNDPTSLRYSLADTGDVRLFEVAR